MSRYRMVDFDRQGEAILIFADAVETSRVTPGKVDRVSFHLDATSGEAAIGQFVRGVDVEFDLPVHPRRVS